MQTPTELVAAAQAETEAQAQAQAAAAQLRAESARQPQAAQAASWDADAPGLVKAMAAGAVATPTLNIRARADLAGDTGAMMTVRIDGSEVATLEVRSATFSTYTVDAPTLHTGAKVEIAFTNDATIQGADRNLHIAYVSDGTRFVIPNAAGVVLDRGAGAAAFDGLDTLPGQTGLFWNAALRMTWPSMAADTTLAKKQDAVRFLQQATFGGRAADVQALASSDINTWLSNQLAQPYAADFVNHIQAKYSQGAAYLPRGASYTPIWVAEKFWERAANAPDQLRQRLAFALHNIFMVSLANGDLWFEGRAFANYYDLLHKHAFGNYRSLLEDIALSPAMGLYLSHMRNRKEDAATGRVPDENFAREVMQLFTIGLYELNNDGTLKLDANGKPQETYGTADVMAMARVFTGWSWAYPDAQLTDSTFRWSTPAPSLSNDPRIDLLPMKAYPGQHSTAAKTLFAGKPWVVTLAAGNTAQADLKLALDTLFNHPNTPPFISRQLIQHLVSSNPSPAYVNRVANVFKDNGQGVRGDLGAVTRAILLDTEARSAPTATSGKLRDPVLKVTHWMRVLGAASSTGQYQMAWVLDDQGERALAAPTVFGYFRPNYVPSNTSFSSRGATAPQFQVLNESSAAAWLNMAESMATTGLGWTGAAVDVAADYNALAKLITANDFNELFNRLDLLMLGGRMPAPLKQQIVELVAQSSLSTADGALSAARAAVFLTLASTAYAYQP
ncbi:DUF1800 family protein [Roseateles sp. BYS87W]|uniref:DUF1800 family protein n=1 Tax=Pelomonas baiyunensis TaxID=3299026 RepID=A0ABW7H3I8_9BURK